MLNVLQPVLPGLIGGSADLAPSNLTIMKVRRLEVAHTEARWHCNACSYCGRVSVWHMSILRACS
jgi:transketolase